MGGGITEKFIEVINKQAVLYKGLKDSIKLEAQALTGSDLKAVDGLVKKEEEAVNKLKELEKEKTSLFEKLASENGLTAGPDLKVRDVLLKMGAQKAAAVEKALAGLIEAVREVDAINAENVHLLKNYIEYAGFTRLLRQNQDGPEQTTYTQDGGKKINKADEGPKIDKTI